ncbi:TolC family protein [Ottowia caeni]|uniref:TolC family protein n=1 Tax=Ottowia caeni TaxID=2870339 RepID=UPI003D722317
MAAQLPSGIGGKRAARTKAAEKSREQAQAQLTELKATVRANVAAAYFDVLTAQERLVLARDSVALAKSSTDTVAKRVAAGKISPVEESKARVAEAGIRVELAQAASEERNALSRLFALLGKIDVPFTVLEGKAGNLPLYRTSPIFSLSFLLRQPLSWRESRWIGARH